MANRFGLSCRHLASRLQSVTWAQVIVFDETSETRDRRELMTIRFQFPVGRTLHIRPTWRAFCVLASCALVFTGCASVMNGRTQVVAVSSDPPGAHVFVDEEHVGVTPTFVDLPRRERNLTLRLDKEGFGSVDVPVRRSPSGWLWGDAALAVSTGLSSGQAIGHRKTEWAHAFVQSAALWFGIDLLTGAAFGRPHHVQATLERRPESPRPMAGLTAPATREGLLLPLPPTEPTGNPHARTDAPRGRNR